MVLKATKKVEVDNADIERFFVDEGYLNKDAMVERRTSCYYHGTR